MKRVDIQKFIDAIEQLSKSKIKTIDLIMAFNGEYFLREITYKRYNLSEALKNDNEIDCVISEMLEFVKKKHRI